MDNLARIIGYIILAPVVVPGLLIGGVWDDIKAKNSSCSHCKKTGMDYCVCGVLMCTNRECPTFGNCYQCM